MKAQNFILLLFVILLLISCNNKKHKIEVVDLTLEQTVIDTLPPPPPPHDTIPNVVGMRFKDAEAVLNKNKIKVASVILQSDMDSINVDLIVYKQNPSVKNDRGGYNHISKRQTMDLWLLRKELPMDTLQKPKRKITTTVHKKQ